MTLCTIDLVLLIYDHLRWNFLQFHAENWAFCSYMLLIITLWPCVCPVRSKTTKTGVFGHKFTCWNFLRKKFRIEFFSPFWPILLQIAHTINWNHSALSGGVLHWFLRIFTQKFTKVASSLCDNYGRIIFRDQRSLWDLQVRRHRFRLVEGKNARNPIP